MILYIDAFTLRHGSQKIPKKYTCDGEAISPGLRWTDVPLKTESFAVIMEELHVPNRSNPLAIWILYNIPADAREIETNSIPEGAKLGTNDLGKKSYSAPCPEHSPVIHHQFSVTLYALDIVLDINTGEVTNHILLKAIKDHILEKVAVDATYEREKVK